MCVCVNLKLVQKHAMFISLGLVYFTQHDDLKFHAYLANVKILFILCLRKLLFSISIYASLSIYLFIYLTFSLCVHL